MMADSRRRSYDGGSRGNISSHNQSSLFRDDIMKHEVDTSSFSLDHNHQMSRQSSQHRQYKDNDDYDYDYDYDDDDDDVTSVLSFQRIKDEGDYDRISYSRKRSNESTNHNYHQVRASSPDRGGGGGSNYDDNYYAYDNKRYSIDYEADADADDRYHYSKTMRDDMRQSSRSRSSRRSHEDSSISYIDYNDSFNNNNRDDKRSSSNRKRYNNGRSRSHSPSKTSSGGDKRLGSTVRMSADITATSTITFDDYGHNHRPQSHSRQQQQPIVGHDGQLVEYTKYCSADDKSKPQVPIDITVPSPEKQQKYIHKTSLDTHHHAYTGREQKKKTTQYSSSLVNVHEMGSRPKQHSETRRSSSTSKASSSSSRRNIDRKGSRSSSTSKRSHSSDGKSKELKREKSSGSRTTKSSKSRKSKESSNSGSSNSNSRRRSRSRNGSDDKQHRQGGDLTRGKATRKLESNGSSTKSSITSDKGRRQRDRRREMMTGRATKHLLDDDKSSTYSRSSVRHDVDDEGYCMHHPKIKLMRLRSDGFWDTVRKKCPECIYEDYPTLMGDEDIDEEDEKQETTPAARLDEWGLFTSARFSLHNIMSPEDIEEEEELNRLKRRLAARAYHFPGNTWCEDWMQYLSNTHTVLGLFFHQ